MRLIFHGARWLHPIVGVPGGLKPHSAPRAPRLPPHAGACSVRKLPRDRSLNLRPTAMAAHRKGERIRRRHHRSVPSGPYHGNGSRAQRADAVGHPSGDQRWRWTSTCDAATWRGRRSPHKSMCPCAHVPTPMSPCLCVSVSMSLCLSISIALALSPRISLCICISFYIYL